ncbi:MAG: glyoxalase [Microbacteriaceae bacterium]|nr:glyoxalase [Microbacteriaceae bacterium]
MFTTDGAFSGFSVDDPTAAKKFYGETLGLEVEDAGNGFFRIHFASGGIVLCYPKPDHTPASFTIMDFPVSDIDAAVDDLNSRGVDTRIYNGGGMPVDEKGVMRGNGPDIAWFRDPAGNILAVLKEG